MLILSRNIYRYYLKTVTKLDAFLEVRMAAPLLPIVGNVGSRMSEYSGVFSYFVYFQLREKRVQNFENGGDMVF
jgi:hypothetical protein